VCRRQRAEALKKYVFGRGLPESVIVRREVVGTATTRWLLALAILLASGAQAHAALEVALPLEAWLVILAIVIAIALILFAISGMGRFVKWFSTRSHGAKALISVLVLSAVVVAMWIYREPVSDGWNLVLNKLHHHGPNFHDYVLTAERERALKPLEVFRECDKNCPEMVVIPAGRFMMGSPVNEKGRRDNEDDGHGHRHEVTIARPFAVGKLDVTFAEWRECESSGACAHVEKTPPEEDMASFPIADVNWYDAKAYVAWLSRMTNKTYRLLTEAEWEYAARAGTTTTYYFGDSCSSCKFSLYGMGVRRRAALDGPNPFGLYDMADSVEQWVEDCYHPNYDGAPADGSAWAGRDCSDRAIRGSVVSDRRMAGRTNLNPRSTSKVAPPDLGFRVARTLTP
jgi:formylglycine-generating enzyme required for sulfatase activity